jgi:hypothetical protein
MGNLVDYAEHELEIIGMGASSTEENKAMHDHIIHMVKEFSKEGHSGFSASYALGILQKLLAYEPLTPLTGKDDEWFETDIGEDDMKWQNKRCFSVFKTADGQTYDSAAVVYYAKGNREDTYTKGGQRTPITFPYVHTVTYVEDDK